ncbi:hypothetical protein I5S84_27900 [Pseudomonas putida]|jgi:hypothetical protein|uniref:Uncharacterized protein n=1 Tax=Pseudomonas juntendi TaxID=2666183 RepID=A0ABD4YF75_9PSED|nr:MULTISPECIES: hypothetical protein [Pseudomonas]MBH3452636.1 hypothetical protein [Pseudomonas putida]MDH0758010.1 hypothetical protein [Pseudomonas juntendi]MDH1919510.1 hypothetical protein [Pseudomonas juntendi]QKL07452.1 hypothetical protein GEV41_13800 [Pseudomonas putida]
MKQLENMAVDRSTNGIRKNSIAMKFAVLAMACSIQSSFSSETTTNKPIELINQAESQNSKCRGGPGDDPYTAVACYERGRIMREIRKHGWCWGPESAYGYQKKWITCSSDKSEGLSIYPRDSKLDPSWRKFSSTIYIMNPENYDTPALSASLRDGKIHINFMDPKSPLCAKGESSRLSESGPYKINDIYVKFQSMCLNGIRLLGPSTAQGKAFMLKALETDGIKAELDSQPPIIFFKTDFESVKRELRKTESAL